MADDLTFDSIDSIEKHFGKLKKAAGDDADAVKSLMLEEREAKADFRDRSATKRELDAHRKELLTGSDLPDEAKELVQGSTVEELDSSFTKIKAMADKMRASNGSAEAEKLYGDSIRPGQGSPPAPRTSEDEKFIADFQTRFNNKEEVKSAELDRYVQLLGGAHLLHGLARNSQHFERRGVTPQAVEAAKGRK